VTKDSPGEKLGRKVASPKERKRGELNSTRDESLFFPFGRRERKKICEDIKHGNRLLK